MRLLSIRERRFFFVVLLVASLGMAFSGCIVLPAIEGVSQLGLSKSDREKLLPKVVKDFNTAIYWDDPMSAAQYVRQDQRDKVMEDLQKSVEGIKVVDTKMENVHYDDDSKKADVRLLVRSYKVPYYVVEDRRYIQKWEFSVSYGWQYVSQSEVKK